MSRALAMRLLIVWAGNCLGILVAAAIVPAISFGDKLGTLALAGAILAIVNFALRPIVILMTLPAVILSLGLALLFVNALMLWLTSALVPGLQLGGFWGTLATAVAVSFANLALRPWRRSQQRPPQSPRIRVELWR